jgi:hypothetical protein
LKPASVLWVDFPIETVVSLVWLVLFLSYSDPLIDLLLVEEMGLLFQIVYFH